MQSVRRADETEEWGLLRLLLIRRCEMSIPVVLGKLTLKFETTTLGQVREMAGVGAIQHRGDAGESEDWLCYTMSDTQPARIWISSGELGGPEHAVGGFYAVANSKDTKKSASCPRLPTQLHPVSLGNPLWLGANPNLLKKLFGEPSAKESGWWLYFYAGKIPAPSKFNSVEGFDQDMFLGARISDGKIVALFVSQTTTT